MSIKRVQIVVFLISASLISYQILLFKMFSIQYWHHFAYLIISIALLGFGISGTFIIIFRRRLKDHLPLVLFFCPLVFVLFIWANIYINRIVAFNPLMLIWDSNEIVHVLCLSVSILIPFFLGALCIGMSFVAAPGHIHGIYFANLAGSGVGSLIILLSLLNIGPYGAMSAVSAVMILASLAAGTNRLKTGLAVAVGAIFIVLYFFSFRSLPPAMSSFKDLTQASNLTSAVKEYEVFGPLGLVTVLDSPAYHYLPDLSLNCPYPLLRQKGLFLDGNTVGAINRFGGSLKELRLMDYRTNAAAYNVLDRPHVLIIGGGSGTEIASSMAHRAESMTVLEMNGDIVRLMQGPYKAWSGEIYASPKTDVRIEEGRGYLQRTGQRFDLIEISLLESMGAASSGVYSLNENYLFTIEAMALYMDRLLPGGVLSISTWIKNPPRDNIKIFATAVEALEHGAKNLPDRSIVMIRSWQTATLLVKNGPFQKKETNALKDFCRARLFDISYYPGIKEKETNRFNKFEKDPFYFAASSIFSGEREKLYDAYPYYIRPATDDRPFFSHFFKLGMLREYLDSANRALIPFLDWGYILVWITACIVLSLGFLFIVAPIPLATPAGRGLPTVVFYFGSLGLAYMFLEMSILQRFILYLYDPVFSASVVIGSFLVYSGIGSLIAGRVDTILPKHIFWAILIIGIVGVFFITADRLLAGVLAELPLSLRVLACSLLIAPLAIPMGIPFPSGLSELAGKQEFIAWAWSVNGFFSVFGSSIAILLAINWGFRAVILIAIFLYAAAACMFARLPKNSPPKNASAKISGEISCIDALSMK